VVLLALMPASAAAQECATPDRVTEEIRREVPDAELRLMTGPAAERLRIGISTLIGQDVPDGGSYLIARAPTSLTAYVVRFADGCATHHGRFPDRLVRAWLDGSPA
jgi:hypothetical protein